MNPDDFNIIIEQPIQKKFYKLIRTQPIIIKIRTNIKNIQNVPP